LRVFPRRAVTDDGVAVVDQWQRSLVISKFKIVEGSMELHLLSSASDHSTLSEGADLRTLGVMC